MNRAAVRMANTVAAEGGALVAANICNTWSYDPADAERTGAVVRAQYEEQLGWAVEEGVDFVVHETNDYVGEALIGLEVCQELGLPALVTFASVGPDAHLRRLRLRHRVQDARRRGRDGGGAELLARPGDDAAAAGRDPVRGRRPDRRPARARTTRTRRSRRSSPSSTPTAGARSRSSSSAFQASRFEMAAFARAARDLGVGYIGGCCGTGPHHVRAMAEALGRQTPASRYSPALELHPVLGTERTTPRWGTGPRPPDRS